MTTVFEAAKKTGNKRLFGGTIFNFRVTTKESYSAIMIADFISIVERNIPNENFSIDDISKELNLSKIQLHRKIKSLMDTNINEYILNMRMQKAKYYLQHEELSIAETAYKTGFSTASYFSTVFKSKTGVSPKAFKEKKSL